MFHIRVDEAQLSSAFRRRVAWLTGIPFSVDDSFVVRWLLDRSGIGSYVQHAFEVAADNGQQAIAKLLLEAGAEVTP